MTALQHHQMFESILYGLTTAKILYGLGSFIKERKSIKPYWVFNLLFLVFFLLVIRQYFIGFNATTHSLIQSPISFVFFVVLSPAIYVLFSHIIVPEKFEGLDLRLYFLEQKDTIYGLLIFGQITQIAENIFGSYAVGEFTNWSEFLVYANSVFFLVFIVTLFMFLIGAVIGYFSKGLKFTEFYISIYAVFVVLIMFLT